MRKLEGVPQCLKIPTPRTAALKAVKKMYWSYGGHIDSSWFFSFIPHNNNSREWEDHHLNGLLIFPLYLQKRESEGMKQFY